MIHSDYDTSLLRTWLVNHTLHLLITVPRICCNNFVASDHSKMILLNIVLHISNIDFWCHVISNYLVGNRPFYIDFDQTIMTYPTSQSLYCINYTTHQFLNACSLIDWVYISSFSYIFILFTSLKSNKVFMIHGFEFRYILLNNESTSSMK